MPKIDHNGLTIDVVFEKDNQRRVTAAALVYAGKYRIDLGAGSLTAIKAKATRKSAEMSDELTRLANRNDAASRMAQPSA